MKTRVLSGVLVVLLGGIMVGCPLADVTPWAVLFGGPLWDVATSIQQTSDDGFIVAGEAVVDLTHSDAFLAKIDCTGRLLWYETYGGLWDDWAVAVRQTSDKGYMLVGTSDSFSFSEDRDLYFIKTNANGAPLWSKTVGGQNDEEAAALDLTSDGGYIACGRQAVDSHWNLYLAKLSAQGIIDWTSAWGGADNAFAEDVEQTTDGGYIACGGYMVDGTVIENIYLLKVLPGGGEDWSTTLIPSERGYGAAVRQTPDGGYVVAGAVVDLQAQAESACIVKTDATGAQTWVTYYEPDVSQVAEDVVLTADGGYMVLVTVMHISGSVAADIHLVRLDADGNVLWTHSHGGGFLSDGYDLCRTRDGGYGIAGWTLNLGAFEEDAYVIRTDAYGNAPQTPVLLTK